ncbi:MAG: zinc ABC transporter substrate-binding protein [Hyphomicrobiales bacterium]|jgi:zinc/manganese transport system substrate-binding protein
MRSSLLALALAVSPSVATAEPLNVVASFSILADMVQQVGGEEVRVTSLVGPGEDAHVYEPVPTDVVAVAGADLVIVNGLGFEGFMSRLIAASETQAPVIVATTDMDVLGVTRLVEDDHDDHAHDDHAHDDHAHDDHAHDDHPHDDHAHDDHAHDDHAHDDHNHGPIDPHAWQSLEAAKLYVLNIQVALCAAREESCDVFNRNAAAYVADLTELESEWQAAIGEIPQEERVVITSHDAFGYLARDFDLTMFAAQGMSTNSEASAADIASLIDQIRDTGARALFLENVSDPRLLEQIADETGLEVSGTLYSDALETEGEASTYLGMMDANLRAIRQALTVQN